MFLGKFPGLFKVSQRRLESLFGPAPALTILKPRDLWALDGPLCFTPRKGPKITIPKGTITDLASVPRILDWVPFLDVDGDSRMPGVLHDGIYKLGRDRGKDFADNILYEACLDLGMANWQAGVYYKGVHWFGADGWREDGLDTNYGASSSNFDSYDDWTAYVAAGQTIYSS